jgi:hypothetical protein
MGKELVVLPRDRGTADMVLKRVVAGVINVASGSSVIPT